MDVHTIAEELRPHVSVPEGHRFRRVPRVVTVMGVIALATSGALYARDPKQLAFSWLVAFLFFLGIALGSLYFVLIHYATQAAWGITLRRMGENVAATIPLFALLFLPIAFSVHELYPWTHAEEAATPAIAAKAPFLNPTFFFVRAAIYFAVWSLIALAYVRGSRRQDETGDEAITRRLRRFAGPSILALAITQTFASIDWIMSLDPHWYSTIFGVYYFAGAFVGFFAFLAVLIVRMRRARLLDQVVGAEHFHDLGKMLFAFTVFWAYIAFSQYFLIWYGNIPEETVFFRERLEGSWRLVSLLLAAGHFVIPFFFLLPRSIKRNPRTLALGGGWILAMHLLDVFWLVAPVLHPEGVHVAPADLLALAAVGCFFLALFARFSVGAPLVPIKDPRLRESLALESS